MSSKALSNTLTSYDLLKAFAVIIMVIDHLGAYEFVESEWMRAVGRTGFPVWFFLVGYARGRNIPQKLLGGAVLLLLANLVVGMPILPLNALFTIIFIRLGIDAVVATCHKNKLYFYGVLAVLVVLVLPSYFVTEYGTQALITALYGYYVRHKVETIEKTGNQQFVMNFMIFSFLTFILYQQLVFGFSSLAFFVMAGGTLLVRMVLLNFGAAEYPKLTQHTPAPFAWFIRLCGRRTLEIYVVHLIAFKIIALALGMDGYGLFDIRLIDLNGLSELSALVASK